MLFSAIAMGSAQAAELLDVFQTLERPSAAEKLISALPAGQLSSLYRMTYNNPVSTLNQVAIYDPTGIIGFCFGRAMAAHLTARQSFHLNPSSIYKLFIVGDLRSNPSQPEWRFHVTTILPVYGNGQVQWVAIDPIMSTPLTVAQWIQSVRAGWDAWHGTPGGKAHFYLVPASAVLPDIRSLPSPESGRHLIELNFDPRAHGIQPNALWANALQTSEPIHVLSEAQAAQYFLVTYENAPTGFDFDGIQINSDYIAYNGYFADLLRTFTSSRSRQKSAAAPLTPLKMKFDPVSERLLLRTSETPLGFNLAPLAIRPAGHREKSHEANTL